MRRQKPTSKSVTDTPCKCGYLQRMSEEPGEPIVFDEEMHEYHITKPGGGYLLIYHCPFCGGSAPPSQRASRFARVTTAEAERLEQLTAKLKTVDQVIKALGKPDWDHPRGLRIQTPAKSGKAPTVETYRTLAFTRLSDTADVCVTDYGVKGIRFTFQGKYLGKPKRGQRAR